MASNSRAKTLGETSGFIKVLADKNSGTILGVHIIGTTASELIAEAVTAISLKTTVMEAARICHAHPTISEAFKEACLLTYDYPLHL